MVEQMAVNYSFMSKKGYKKIINHYLKGTEQLLKLNKMQVKEERIQSVSEEVVNGTFKLATQFVKEEKQRIADKLVKIQESYKQSKGVYNDPTAELLRRQDFDLEVSLMDDQAIAELLNDSGRTLSTYELRKIATHDKLSSQTQATVQRQMSGLKRPYEADQAYIDLQKELAELELINSPVASSLLLYTPNENKSVSTLSLSSLGLIRENTDKLQKEVARLYKIEEQLKDLKESSLTAEDIGVLGDYSTGVKTKTQSYDDFDRRAIRGTKEFTIKDRFKYLEERYDDKSTDRFDILRDDYSVTEHFNYLERKHNERLSSDPEFKAEYESVASEE